jgi:endo-alpha-1,4-polygalactosaminidase (GH114 family)
MSKKQSKEKVKKVVKLKEKKTDKKQLREQVIQQITAALLEHKKPENAKHLTAAIKKASKHLVAGIIIKGKKAKAKPAAAAIK